MAMAHAGQPAAGGVRGGGWLALLGALGLAGATFAALNAHLGFGPLWAALAASLLALMGGLGAQIQGDWRGALLDERKRISLSRLQVLLWTLLILSALGTATLLKMQAGTNPLDISIPAELWAVMGLSGVAGVGKKVILNGKEGLRMRGAGAPGGLVARNATPQQATWANLVTGDETVNQTALDLGKLPLLIFSTLTALAYAGALWQTLSAGSFAGFPPIEASLVALLTVSNVGYLAEKAAPHTPTEP